MDRISHKELRNNFGGVLRRVESGAAVEITVSGRPVAQLLPIEKPVFVSAERFREVFRSSTDPAWMDDVRGFEAGVTDPFE